MSGATFPRIKVWAPTGEDVLTTDLNAEFDNILNNLSPVGMDDYSSSVAQMRATTSPGGVGTESLATSTAGELERLRFVLSRMIGETYWYDTPNITLAETYSLITQTSALPRNRITSGKTRSATDTFPIHLFASGGAATVTLDATPDAFKVRIDDVEYTFVADAAFTGLSLAPAVNNTCLVNNALLTGQVASKYAGEFDSEFPTIIIDTVGAAISALVGQFAAFSAGTEYFIAYVKSATELVYAFRGYFFDSTNAPLVRTTLADNAVITLARLTWVFAKSDLTLDVAYSNPVFAAVAPTAPLPGDYWFDLTAKTWKKYNGAIFVVANAHLIGACVQDTVACKASRSFPAFAAFDPTNTILTDFVSVNQIKTRNLASKVSVAGQFIDLAAGQVAWNMAGDLEAGFAEAASTTYYGYVTEFGGVKLSPERPHPRDSEVFGRYHPYHNWRAVFEVANTAGSDFDATTLVNYGSIRLTERDGARIGTVAPVGGIAASAFSGISAISSILPAYAQFTSLTVSLATTGRPVRLFILGQPLGTASHLDILNGGGATRNASHQFRRVTAGVATLLETCTYSMAAGVTAYNGPVTVLSAFDLAVPAGQHTYSFEGGVSAFPNVTLQLTNVRLVAYEI